MAGRVRTQPSLRVTFERGGRQIESEVAPTGRDAVKLALMTIVRLDYLQDGDRLTVTESR